MAFVTEALGLSMVLSATMTAACKSSMNVSNPGLGFKNILDMQNLEVK